MITASFDGRHDRTGAVSGAYQYDTGQRLVMHGLPSPAELAGEDDLLSGDLVTVQAQFSYRGDSQAEMRLAMWDEKRKVWTADVPDAYLTRHRDVQVHVFCYYGADETGERGETAYEATFRPISRPAPSGTVTGDQLKQWADLKAEIEISLSKADNAVSGADSAAAAAHAAGNRAGQEGKNALDAAQAAEDAKDALEEAGERIGHAQGAAKQLAAGEAATAGIDLSGETGRLILGAPKGAEGPKGDTGDKGPADIALAWDAETRTLTISARTTDEGSE